jgi:RND family efflux transporter MFP subunit
VAIGGGAFYFWLQKETEIPVTVIRAQKGAITATLSATGKVVSQEEAQISAPAPALVQAVDVDEGDHVDKGAVLARLDDRELKQTIHAGKATLREAEEKVRQSARNYGALRAVLAAGGVSRQSVDDAKSLLDISRAAVARARAELAANRIALDKRTITAPFAGIVTRKEIHPGEWASPGVTLFTLSKENRREIEVMVDESDAGLVHVGQPVELSCDAFPGVVWMEAVTEVAPAVQKEGTANSIKVDVSYGPKAPNLKLGQQVDVKIHTAHKEDVVKLPFEAVIARGGNQFVAVVVDGRVRFVPVKTGIEDALSVQIQKGVSAGEEIILPQGRSVTEGERVKPVPRKPSPS